MGVNLIFPENCINMKKRKKLDRGGGRAADPKFYYLDPPLNRDLFGKKDRAVVHYRCVEANNMARWSIDLLLLR